MTSFYSLLRRTLVVIGAALLSAQAATAQSDVQTADTAKTQTVGEAVVTAEKPQITGADGVIAVDLPNLVKGKPVGNVYESLAYLPGMTKDTDGNLSLAGAGSLTILINGKRPQMPQENLVALLQSYPVERLRKAEVMYSTPAKYHVQGASINLILKNPSVLDGLQGQVGTDYVQQHYAKGSGNAAVAYNAKKWGFDAMYKFTAGKSWAHNGINSRHLYGGERLNILQDERTVNKASNHNGHLGLDWRPGKDNKLSLAWNFQFSPVDYARNLSSGTLDTYTTAKDYPSAMKFNNAAIDYESSFGLSLGASFTKYKEGSNTTLRRDASTDVVHEYTSSQHVERYHFYADQTHDVKQWTINYGLSFDYSADRSAQAYATAGSTDFSTRIEEYAGDAYLGFEHRFKRGISLTASLKADYYHRHDETRWWLSPQVALTYMKTPRHIFQVNVSSQKTEPSYWEIHGGDTWLNNYLVVSGNPLLKPSYTYTNQLVYIYRQKYMAVLYFNHTDDFIVQQPYQSATALSLSYKTQNFNYSQMLGLMLRAPFSIGHTLQSTLTLNGYYTHNKADNYYGLRFNREKCSFYANLDNSIRLTQRHPIFLTIGASALTASLQGVADISSIWKIDAGAKWTLLKGKADLTVSATDLFNRWSPTITFDRQGQDLRMNTYDLTRQLKVSFVYRFNSFKPKTYDLDDARFGIGK